MAKNIKKNEKSKSNDAGKLKGKSVSRNTTQMALADPARSDAIKEKKAEQTRKSKRRNRQFLGFFLSILVVIGAFSIIQRGVTFFEEILDNAMERDEYKQRIEVMVWFDMLPFQDVSQVDQNVLKQVSIWSTYNQKDKEGTNITNENEEILISDIEINRHAASLFGNEFRYASHMTFTEPFLGLTYVHDDAREAYAIPITSADIYYYPRIMNIKREDGGRRRVTVGYLLAVTEDGSIIRNPEENEPAKYMDFIFQRDGNNFYLVALERNTEIEVDIPDTSSRPLDEDEEPDIQDEEDE